MTELEKICEEIGITMNCTYDGIGSSWGSTDENFPCFDWKVTLMYQGRTMNVDYHAGMAHVLINKDWTQTGHDKYTHDFGNTVVGVEMALLNEAVSPKPPTIAVVHCVVTDSYAISVTFEDWCSEMGYNSDSIKIKKMFDACVVYGMQFQMLLDDEELFDKLTEAEH